MPKIDAFKFADYIIALFCEIYRGKGYYVVWDEDLCFDMCDQTECATEQVSSILKSCLEARLFDPDLYASQHILTSCALQQRYIKINQDCKRKRTIDPTYCLFSADEVSQKENANAAVSPNADCRNVNSRDVDLQAKNAYNRKADSRTRNADNRNADLQTGNTGSPKMDCRNVDSKTGNAAAMHSTDACPNVDRMEPFTTPPDEANAAADKDFSAVDRNGFFSQQMNVAGTSELVNEKSPSAADKDFSTVDRNGLSSHPMGATEASGLVNEKNPSVAGRDFSTVDRNGFSSQQMGAADTFESTNDRDSSANRNRVSSEVTEGEERVSSEKMPQNKPKESKAQKSKEQHSKREKNRPQQTAFPPTGKAEEGAATPVVKSPSSSQTIDNQEDVIVKPILKLNLDAINVKNAKTVQAINALSQRPEIGGLNGVLWKVLSMQYRPLLVRKENPGDYILWALNHPEMFTETYTHFLQKKCRG